MTLAEGMQEMNIDNSTTLNRFGNNEGLYLRFLRKISEDPTFSKLREAVEEKKYDEIEISAHTLKGVAGNLGLDKLMKSCSDLVNDIRSGSYDQIDEHFKEAEQDYDQVLHTVEEIDG